MTTETRWRKTAKEVLLNRKIVAVEYLRVDETTEMGWYDRPIAFKLDNGIWVYPARDEEGNDGGVLFTTDTERAILPALRRD